MNSITKTLGKKALALICTMALLLSCVSVCFGAYASGDSAEIYVVSPNKPAIPVTVGYALDLSKIQVTLDNGSTALGGDLSWSVNDGGVATVAGSKLVIDQSGVAKLTATDEAGNKAVIYAVTKGTNDEYVLYEHTFSPNDLIDAPNTIDTEGNPIGGFMSINANSNYWWKTWVATVGSSSANKILKPDSEWAIFNTVVQGVIGKTVQVYTYDSTRQNTELQGSSSTKCFYWRTDKYAVITKEDIDANNLWQYTEGKGLSINTNQAGWLYIKPESEAGQMIGKFSDYTVNYTYTARNNNVFYILGRYSLNNATYQTDSSVGFNLANEQYLGVSLPSGNYAAAHLRYSGNKYGDTGNFDAAAGSNTYNVKMKLSGNTASLYYKVPSASSYKAVFENAEAGVDVSNLKGTIAINNAEGTRHYSQYIAVVLEFDESETAVPESKIQYVPVVGPEGTTVDSSKNEKYFSTLSAAIDYLGEGGGKVYVKGTYTPKGDAELDGAMASRALVTVAGYGDNAAGGAIEFRKTAGSYVDNTNFATLARKGDIKFENITFNCYGDGDTARAGGFHSYGNHLIFGEGVVNSNTNTRFGSAMSSSKKNVISAYSGNYYIATPYTYAWPNTETKEYNVEVEYNLYGTAKITSVYTNPISSQTNGTVHYSWINKSDFTLNLRGGTVTDVIVGTFANYSNSATQGNILINVESGKVNTVSLGNNFDRGADPVLPQGNVAIVLEANRGSGTTVRPGTSSQIAKLDGKKFSLIINHAENSTDSVTFSTQKAETLIDYYVRVTNGKAEPVYSGKGAASTLIGFRITPDMAGSVIKVDGAEATLVEGYTDVYALPEKDYTAIEVICEYDYTVVVASPDYQGPQTEKVFSDVPAAINYLGAEGGVIYIKGYVTTAAGLENGGVVSHGLVTIKGYGDTSEGNGLKVTAPNALIYGDIKFENIGIAGGTGSASFVARGGSITFGEGTTTYQIDGVTQTLKISAPTYYVGSAGNKLILDSSTLSFSGSLAAAGAYGNQAWNGDSDIVFNNGALLYTDATNNGRYVLGAFSNNVGASGQIYNGDIKFTLNGGEIASVAFGLGGTGSSGTSGVSSSYQQKGNSIFVMNDGKITRDIYFGSPQHNHSAKVRVHNVAYIINSATMTNSVRVMASTLKNSELVPQDTSGVEPTFERYNETSKWILIINNVEKNKVDSRVPAADIDYSINVAGGAAQPIFSERTDASDASTSVLTGFAITPDEENAGKLVVANGTDILTATNGVYDLSDYERELVTITFADEVEIEATEETVTGTELDAYKNGKVPVKEGYLFGGFIGEDGKALKADEIANAESLTVKFIPKAVLDIGWQIRQNGNTVDLRLISTVDSLEYSAVTFIVKVAGRDDMVLTSKKVYTKIAGYKDGENVQYAPTSFSAASEYFMTHVITGIPASFHGTDFTVTANLLTKDGKTITGDAITFQIKDHADYTAIVE